MKCKFNDFINCKDYDGNEDYFCRDCVIYNDFFHKFVEFLKKNEQK